MSDTGLVQKMVEAGISAAKATTDEIKTSISTAAGQITGAASSTKSDAELQQLAKSDKEQSASRIDQIKKELASKRFQEVSQWNTAPKQTKQEVTGPEIPSSRGINTASSTNRNTSGQPESVRQAVGKSELGRNFKG